MGEYKVFMRKKIFFLLFFTVLSTAVQAQFWQSFNSILGTDESLQPVKTKVLIHPLLEGALLDVKGSYKIYNPMDGSCWASRLFKKSRFIQPTQGGLRWGEEFPGVYQLAFVPEDNQTTILVNGIEYKGSVYVYQIGDDQISIVNELDIEDFIKSTLSLQVTAPMEPEALASLAIVARTDAYYQRLQQKGKFWYQTAEQSNYKGYAVTFAGNGVERAVDDTKYLVMRDIVQSQYFPARWTKDSGGKTASYLNIFRRAAPGPNAGVEAPFALVNRQNTAWDLEISTNELASIFNLQDIDTVEVFKDPETHRVYGLRIRHNHGQKELDFASFQKAIGKRRGQDRLLSNDFQVKLEGNQVRFNGFGIGHGVGLCIYSAEQMAKQEQNASRILADFFPGTSVEMAAKELPSSNEVSVREQEGVYWR